MAMAENRKPTRSKVKESGRRAVVEASRLADEGRAIAERAGVVARTRAAEAVSYTHLTLPTIYSV